MKTTYQCQNPDCLAADSDNGVNPPAPRMLICWKCKYGKGQGEIGMLPIQTDEEAEKV
jgi:hypothetical protein